MEYNRELIQREHSYVRVMGNKNLRGAAGVLGSVAPVLFQLLSSQPLRRIKGRLLATTQYHSFILRHKQLHAYPK